jgi:hypothetical protein
MTRVFLGPARKLSPQVAAPARHVMRLRLEHIS